MSPVRDRIRDYEDLSTPLAALHPPRRSRPPIPRFTEPHPRPIVHPLLRAAQPTARTPTRARNNQNIPSHNLTNEPRANELSRLSTSLTTPTRPTDDNLSLSSTIYSNKPFSNLSNSSVSTTVVNPTSLTTLADESGYSRSRLKDFTVHIPVDEIESDTNPGDSTASNPTPSKDVFSKDAPVLSLPALDDYLAKIAAPEFTPVQIPSQLPSGKPNDQAAPRMFIPLQTLASGRSLADLFYNNKIPAPWRNRNSIFSFVRPCSENPAFTIANSSRLADKSDAWRWCKSNFSLAEHH